MAELQAQVKLLQTQVADLQTQVGDLYGQHEEELLTDHCEHCGEEHLMDTNYEHCPFEDHTSDDAMCLIATHLSDSPDTTTRGWYIRARRIAHYCEVS